MFHDISNGDFPKTLIIRNSQYGIIWQIYHVEEMYEAEKLSAGATSNGFHAITLEDHQPDESETFPTWRDECSWLKSNESLAATPTKS